VLDEELERDLVNEVLQQIREPIEAARTRWSHRLIRHSGSILRARRSRSAGFEERLQQRWREPLDLYELALYLTQRFGDDFRKCYAPFAARAKFTALFRLHGNAELIAGEVLQLLRGGFASGAHARWRSLHETGITAAFIARETEETAERFIAHAAVKSFEDAERYQQHCEELGEPPFLAEELSVLKRKRDEMVQRYGDTFAGSYGWARQALAIENPGRKGNITFSEIEAATSLSFWAPYYRVASHSVHPTAKTIRFNIGSLLPVEESILAGPSNYGLADPGYHSLVSMNIVNKALMSYAHDLVRSQQEDLDVAALMRGYEPLLQSMVTVAVLGDLADRAGEAFIRVQREIEIEHKEGNGG
jgi:Family of unknown function (DUF5677)